MLTTQYAKAQPRYGPAHEAGGPLERWAQPVPGEKMRS